MVSNSGSLKTFLEIRSSLGPVEDHLLVKLAGHGDGIRGGSGEGEGGWMEFGFEECSLFIYYHGTGMCSI